MSRRRSYSYRSLREGTPSLHPNSKRSRGLSHKPTSSQSRSPPRSTSGKLPSYSVPPTGGKQLPKELSPPKSAPSHSRSSKRHYEPKDKSKDPIKDSEKERSDIVPSSQQDLVAPGSRDYDHGPETQAKLVKLRE